MTINDVSLAVILQQSLRLIYLRMATNTPLGCNSAEELILHRGNLLLVAGAPGKKIRAKT